MFTKQRDKKKRCTITQREADISKASDWTILIGRERTNSSLNNGTTGINNNEEKKIRQLGKIGADR